jgi:hypothetical protein
VVLVEPEDHGVAVVVAVVILEADLVDGHTLDMVAAAGHTIQELISY